MITIFKYEISGNNKEVELPLGAEILSVAFQGSIICMWAKVDTEAKTEIRNFGFFGTGWEISYAAGVYHKFIGTAHMDNGFVFHVVEYRVINCGEDLR